MSDKLNEIRKTIDNLDNQIHDLLMQRASLIIDICEEKRKNNRPVVQPAREAMMIRRLLGRHEGELPQAAIVGIWRELVGAVCMLQKGLRVHVVSGEAFEYCWDSAKNYFGSVLPMTRSASAQQAISAVREDDSNIAVVPWPEDDQDQPWWLRLLNQDGDNTRKMRIVGALPYGAQEPFETLPKKSLIVAKIDYANSGEDHSFILVEINAGVSRTRIQSAFKEQDLSVLGLASQNASVVSGRAAHLIEVDDFVAEDDERLQKIAQVFEEYEARCTLLGGYPIPPIFRKGDADPIGDVSAQESQVS